MIAGGIGITPFMSMLRSEAQADRRRPYDAALFQQPARERGLPGRAARTRATSRRLPTRPDHDRDEGTGTAGEVKPGASTPTW